MADKKISELNVVSLPLSGTEEIPIVQNGETVKVNVGNLRADTSEFVEKIGDTMTGALNIDATGTALNLKGSIDARSDVFAESESIIFNPRNSDETGDVFGGGVVWQSILPAYTKKSAGIIQVGEANYLRSGLAFFTNNVANETGDWSEAMRIRHNGDVGIGKLPESKLDVNGDLRAKCLIEHSYKEILNSGSFSLYWNYYGNYEITLTQNTTFFQFNTPPLGYSQVITINVIGDFALTLPIEWEVKNGGVYDGVNGSQIVVQSWDNGNFYTVINNEQ